MATIVAGEASESDEEEINVSGQSHIEQDSAEESRSESETVQSSVGNPSAGDALAEGTQVPLSNLSDFNVGTASHESRGVTQEDTNRERHHVTVLPKYKGLIQKQLVDKLLGIKTHTEQLSHHSYTEATKQLQTLTKSAHELSTGLKHSAHQLQLLTNDLFRLEDYVDEINKVSQLPAITVMTSE